MGVWGVQTYFMAMCRRCRCRCCARHNLCGCCGVQSIYDDELTLFGDWRRSPFVTRMHRNAALTPHEYESAWVLAACARWFLRR